ncbi:EpsG family protein [Pseudoalteromonas sp. SR44-5]|uniref:EpsG family protein n=1 Tax=Pseudoalteromonas sp. SR44-5 TaxID=2760934 RepID=UPI001600390B|nr:EpsG family protein [Pseudoalteromonas sp. SR44-5]MBB1368465.1 EpsG family protein [Pseudoalteromonas sp. SR44-5]
MVLYIFIFPISVAILFLFANNKQQRKISLVIIGCFLSWLVGFRAPEVGIDTLAYYDLYEQVVSGSNEAWLTVKLGWVFIYTSLFSDWLGADASFVTFIYALLTIFFIFKAVYYESDNISLSIAIFLSGLGLFAFMHNVMRQALATAIILYSVRFIYQRNLIKFTLVTIVAMATHMSAIFFYPFYFLTAFRFPVTWLSMLWVASLPFIIFKEMILKVLNVFSFLIPGQYIGYLDSSTLMDKGGVSGVGMVLLLKQLILVLLLIAYKRNLDSERKRVIFLLALFSIIIGNYTLGLGILGRFNTYLSIFLILAIPLAIESLVKSQHRYVAHGMLIVVCFVIYIRGLVGEASGLLPT